MKYALEVLQGHMVCGAREGRAALVLTKWILAPKWHPLGSRRGCGWERGGRRGSGMRVGNRENQSCFFHPLQPSRKPLAPGGRGTPPNLGRRNLGKGFGAFLLFIWQDG